MAGEQDILSLGLNIDSFDAKKKKVLTEYIKLFNDLSKYDGKIFNPVMGDGLTTFNTSIAQTTKLLDEMNARLAKVTAMTFENNKANMANSLGLSETGKAFAKNTVEVDKNVKIKQLSSKVNKDLTNDYAILKKALADQATSYSNLYIAKGKDHEQTKAALRTYQQTAGVINGIDNQLAKSGGMVGATAGLRTMFGYLRNIAYILPGLGIAGIFNLLFEGIEKVLDSLHLFDSSVVKTAEKNKYLNEVLLEQLQVYSDLNEKRKELDQFSGVSAKNAADKSDIDEARGIAKDKLIPQQLKDAELAFNEAKSRMAKADPGWVQKLAFDELEAIKILRNEVDDIQKARKLLLEILPDAKTKRLDVQIEDRNSEIALRKERYNQYIGQVKDYYSTEKALLVKQAEYKKFQEDEQRKLTFETAQQNISVSLEKNKKVLNDDRNFHDAREVAIKGTYNNEVSLAKAALANIEDNISSTEKEKQIARNKFQTDSEKARIKRDQEITKNDIEFYQRKVLAINEIAKDQIEMEAIASERIFLNEKHSLEERLNAYEDYIIKKQQIKDIEFTIAIQKGAAGPGGRTALTPEEQQRVGVHNTTQKFNIQADAEKQNYNIVKSALDAELKLVVDKNNEEININREAYAKELQATNERFKNKIFSYNAFKRNKEFIDKKYGVILSADDEIKRDVENADRLQKLYDDLLKKKAESDKKLAGANLNLASDVVEGTDTLESERHYDEELGRNNAFNDAILKAKEELDEAIKKGEDDKVKQAKARYEQLIQFQKEFSDNWKRIEESAWDFAEMMINRNVENDLRAIQLRTEHRDEELEKERDAIEKSSLTAKDKVALDIQLTQQKIELDKAAALEERRIKHDAAVKDRELSIAHVTLSGIEAVVSALKLPPPAGEILAAQRGLLAGIQLAKILAVPIPSFAEGTDNFKGGMARFGEAGAELVKEPGKKPFIALEETISHLDPGTKIIPLNRDHPEFNNVKPDESWEQTRYLAKYIAKNNKKEIKNIFKPTIVVDMNFENHKRSILGR